MRPDSKSGRRVFAALAALAISLASVAGCYESGEVEPEEDTGLDADADSDADSDTDADTDSDSDVDTDSDTDVDSDADTDTAYDCESLPEGPLSFDTVSGIVSGEDIAFDDEGFLIGMSGGSLFKSTKEGTTVLWASAAGCASGLRTLPTGDVVCNGPSSFFRFDKETGTKTTVVTSLDYPNGIEIDHDGFAYVSEQSSGQVTRIDPYTGDTAIVASGLDNPNGMSFSPDYRTLYIGSFCGGYIYKVEFDDEGDPGPAEVFLSTSDPVAIAAGMTGCFDGMGVDICGNVYICDYGNIHVYRIPPDESTVETLANLSSASYWIPNMQWGSGLDEWYDDVLYVADINGAVYEIPVDVPSKHRDYP